MAEEVLIKNVFSSGGIISGLLRENKFFKGQSTKKAGRIQPFVANDFFDYYSSSVVKLMSVGFPSESGFATPNKVFVRAKATKIKTIPIAE